MRKESRTIVVSQFNLKKILLFGFCVVICILCLPQELPKYAPGQIIVRVKGDIFEKCEEYLNQATDKLHREKIEDDSTLKKFGIYRIESLHYVDKANTVLSMSDKEKTYVFYTNSLNIIQIIERIKKLSDVEDAYPNYLFITHVEPDDDKYDD